jgi:hypothetical protein
MMTMPGIAARLITLADTILVPPWPEPLPPEPPEPAPRNLPPHLRHLAPVFAARLPIGFGGMAEAMPDPEDAAGGLGRWLYLYRDAAGLPRALDAEGHDRDGIGSLFGGDERLLARFWPARRGKWDHGKAAETLLCHSARVGTVRGEGFALVAEPPELRRAHLVMSRMAARKLWRGNDPYLVLDLARAWNATRGHGALSDAAIVAIVDAACARELSLSERTFAHAG